MPSSFLQNMVFRHFMYTSQEQYEEQLRKLGLMDPDAFTCTCYMDEVGNVPKQGEVLSWSESSAVVLRQFGAGSPLQPQFGHY